MTAQRISGRDLANTIIETKLIPQVQQLNKKNIHPKLVVILVGENAASKSYIRQKEKSAEKAGLLSEVRIFASDITEQSLLKEIDQINQDDSIHGVIVQLPLPDHISIPKVLRSLAPQKDVDGFTPENVGKLFLGEPTLECCTPKGILTMLKSTGIKLTGKKAVVIGRSNIVGKPVAALLTNHGATVTICHSRTRDLKNEIATAEILIVAVGKAKFITGDMIPKGCIVIDVGMNRTDNGKLCGDVDYESAHKKASFITPVPGGVGPMTVVSLIENTIQAAQNTYEKKY